MARRERYTERNRPHRKEVTRHHSPEAARPADGFSNPVVLIAIGGLVLAVFLALGVILGRGGDKTASTGTPGAGTETTGITETSGITDTTGVTETTGVTTTEGITETTGVTDTTGVTTTGETRLSIPGDGKPYAAPDDMKLEVGTKAYFANIETISGTIQVELWPEIAPAHVNSFVFLARKGFFDGLTFHRVEDWVVQGGDPTGTGSGGPGYGIPAEFNASNPVPHSYGTFAMARSGDPDSGGSQFYFIKKPEGASHLDGQYTVFGHVVSGMDIVKGIAIGDKMTKVTISEAPIAERKVSPDDIRAGKLPEPAAAAATQ